MAGDQQGMAGDLLAGEKHSETVVGARGESSTLSYHRAVDLDDHRRCVGVLVVLQWFLQRVEYHAEDPLESGSNGGMERNLLAPKCLH